MRILTAAIVVPLAIAAGSLLTSQKTGIGPGNPVATQMPGCGALACHQAWMGGLPGGNNLKIFVAPTARSLTSGQSISVTTSATGGDPDPKQWGGFCGFADRGTFVPGTRSRNYSLFTLNDITHTQNDTQGAGRTWTFGYKAPSNYVGVVNMFMAVNTVNGDDSNLTGDNWGFHGSDSANTDSTPIRLYVNATGVTPFGSSCIGGYDQYPVLGSKTVPTVGNASFAVEGHGLATASLAAMVLGPSGAFTPVDLAIINAPGCILYVNPALSFSSQTTPGIARRAEGTVTFPLGVPNDPGLQGQKFDVQAVVVDLATSGIRGTPITLTNALTITIQ